MCLQMNIIFLIKVEKQERKLQMKIKAEKLAATTFHSAPKTRTQKAEVKVETFRGWVEWEERKLLFFCYNSK